MISIRFNDYLNLVEDLFFEKKIKRGEKIRAIFVLRKQSLIDSNQTVLYRFSSLFGIFIFEIFFLFVPPSIFAIIVYKILNYAILISLFFLCPIIVQSYWFLSIHSHKYHFDRSIRLIRLSDFLLLADNNDDFRMTNTNWENSLRLEMKKNGQI